MADWKKVIVSGSSPELNIISASGNISASGKWYANLDEADNQDILVAYDPSTGEFQYKNLSDFPGAPGS
jgi:hypothetical protein